MLAFDTTSSPETAKKLSHQFRRYRIICGMTQKRLSKETGVALRTITRFENGEEVGLLTFISLLEGVGLTHNLEGVIPDVSGDLPQRVRRLTKKKKGRGGTQLDNKKLDFESELKFNTENFDYSKDDSKIGNKLFECEEPDKFDEYNYKGEELFYLRSAAISLKRIADFLSE